MPNKYELTIIDNNEELGFITESSVERLYSKFKEEYSQYCKISNRYFKRVLKKITVENPIIDQNFKCILIRIKNKTKSEVVINNIKRKKMYIKYLVNYLKEHDLNDFLEFKDFKIPE